MSLNPRQKKFALLYVRYGNATKAYGEAYTVPKTDEGKLPSWCGIEAHRHLKNPIIAAEVTKLRGESAALADMSREEVLDYLVAAISTPIEEIGPDSPLCEEYEVRPDGTIKTKSVSKLGAIKELARITGMAEPQKLELSADDSLGAIIKSITGAKEK